MVDDIALSIRARGSDWIIVRIDNQTGAESYYMAGIWVSDARFGKRIWGYGNTLQEKDKIPDERGFTYEIRPSG